MGTEPQRKRHHLLTGDQLRAARAMAGMTQKDLASALGINERKLRFWERRRNCRPTSDRNSICIQEAFAERGVILFAEPTVGVRLANLAPTCPADMSEMI